MPCYSAVHSHVKAPPDLRSGRDLEIADVPGRSTLLLPGVQLLQALEFFRHPLALFENLEIAADSEPHVWRNAEDALDPEGDLGRELAAPLEDHVEPWTRDPEGLGELSLIKTSVIEQLLSQNVARRGRRCNILEQEHLGHGDLQLIELL